MSVQLFLGDCLDIMRGMDAGSVDAVVCDPPYEIGFMNKAFDRTGISYNVDMWREVLRVLKPGGHLLSFGGTRTYHRMACAIEDAGFEIRDQLQWLYGSGFPKSLDISKSIDKTAGAEREVTGEKEYPGAGRVNTNNLPRFNGNCYANGETYQEAPKRYETAPATPDAARWQGWGTALKPANEPLCLARKPLSEATVAANVLRFGTGALNIDATRIGNDAIKVNGWKTGGKGRLSEGFDGGTHAGRWPANVLLDEEAAAALDEQSGERNNGHFPDGGKRTGEETTGIYGRFNGGESPERYMNDTGGASRFFYCAKASRSERNAGLEGMPETISGMSNGAQKHGDGYDKGQDIGLNRVIARQNHHPTVKPVSLMRWLVRLVTPPGGIVLDPFMGSGTTGIACALEGFDFAGIEISEDYYAIAERRIADAQVQLALPFDMPISLEADAAT